MANCKSKCWFPFKLHAMLESVEKEGKEGIVSWTANGTGIRIHKPKEFEEEVLPKHFNGAKYRSFLRQLSIYDFHRVRDKHLHHCGAYCHPLFVRGDLALCRNMKRTKVKGTGFTKENRKQKARESEKIQEVEVTGAGSASSKSFKKTNMEEVSLQALQGMPRQVSCETMIGSEMPQELTLIPTNQLASTNRSNDWSLSLEKIHFDMFGPMGRRESLLYDGDLVSFGGKNFFFTSRHDALQL